MDNGEDGVTAIEECAIKIDVDRFVRGEPAAADHENNSGAVLFFGCEDIEGEGGAEFAAVDDIFGALDRHVFGERGKDAGAGEEKPVYGFLERHACDLSWP